MVLKNSPLLTNGDEKYSLRSVVFLAVCFIFIVLLGVAIPILIQSNSLYSVELLYDYQPGELANEDVIAPYDFSFDDQIATEKLREENAAAVIPRFTFSMAETQHVKAKQERLDEILRGDPSQQNALLRNEFGADEASMITRWNLIGDADRNTVLLLFADAIDNFLYKGIFSSADIANVNHEGYDLIYGDLPSDAEYNLQQSLVYTDNLITEKNISDSLLDFLQSYNVSLSPASFSVLFNLLSLAVEPNVHYDALETQKLRDEARANTEVVTAEIHKGDYILRYDTIVTEQALQTIQMINGITVDVSIIQIISQIIFLSVILYVSLYFMRDFIERKYRVLLYTNIYLITLAIILIVTYIAVFLFQSVAHARDQLIPFLFLPVLMCQLTSKKRIGFLSGAVYSCFIIFFPTTSIMTFFYLIFSIEISMLLMKFSVTRLDTVYQTFYTALANVCITAVFHFIQGKELIYLFSEIVAITLNVTVTYILISILLPLMEHFLNIPTVFRLHELSSTDSPVLIRLRTQAIGTYNHVLNVSNMAYNAAKEIGANAELARVGALYHDIGKAEHPEYFIENQGGGPNVHDDMKYTLSAAVIKSHVKLGVEKGKEIGLPQEVLDIIDQHHGNDIIFYFYNKALEEAKESKTPMQVNEEDFRYTSDIPQSKEAGIVMLADCFEAATRSLKKPTTLRYEKVFTSILVGKMNASQLDDCKLSMSEIEKIKKVFVHQVFGRDHNRIQYTKEEND